MFGEIDNELREKESLVRRHILDFPQHAKEGVDCDFFANRENPKQRRISAQISDIIVGTAT